VGRLFHSLRFQVFVGLVAVAAVCIYIGVETSRDELSGAYRDSARSMLQGSAKGFKSAHDASAMDSPERLLDELEDLMRSYPALQSAAIYARGRDTPIASVGRPDGDSEVLVTPIEGGRVSLAYDMRPVQGRLDERNRRLLIVILSMAAGAVALVLLGLGRRVFRPIERLRAAAAGVGAGDLGTRLRWRRRDELGELATEFDAMATYLEQNQRRLEELAHRDPLTDLVNHRRFQELLAQALDEARASGRPFAVVLLDVDDFKRVNEQRGHPYGDELLGAAAAGLESAMRGLGTAARVGGDEFGLVVPDADAPRAFAMAEAARTAVEVSTPERGALRCSAGVACYPEDAKSPGVLLQLAAGALRWAKDSGGARTRRYDPEHVFVITDEQREDFARLIARPDVVRPVFQPIVSLASGEVVGYEALARFEGRPGLTPSSWFSQAHRLGLGAQLEGEAVRAALAVEDRPPGTFLSINVSPSGLASEAVLRRLPEDLSGLVLEITEEERVLDIEALQRHLDPLRTRGARIAVDDAGEGYAGLQQVMSMRADIIKLDRALVAEVHSDPAKVALIGSLVHFARSTGASICAEGIETLEELRLLIHLGVAYGQGWALARPGAAWGRVNGEAAGLCRSLRSERPRVVPLRRGA
jgi:diguanylate cyclase (GGDEF)-like protein